MKKNYRLIVVLLLVLFQFTSYAQGCSDAGFCTINSFKPISEVATKKNQIKLGMFLGAADNAVSVWGNYLEYNTQISEKFSLDTKLTSISQNGNGYSSFGLGDLFLNTNFKLDSKWTFTIGTKIPLSNGNQKEKGLALPMDYQSSLGTFDAIVGFGYQINKLQFVLAWQQPLTQNKNEFLAENLATPTILKNFHSSNGFKRSGDVLFRIAYPIPLTNQLNLTSSLLPIYHLTNDRFVDINGIEKTIHGSKGLTLNGNVFLDYNLNTSNGLQLNLGMPLVVRNIRPDGLTRGFIATLEYKFKF
jgi:hypothetical protein